MTTTTTTTELAGGPRYVFCNARIRFRVVAWDGLAAGQSVHYRPARDGDAYGPATVVDPAGKLLRNAGGAEFRLTSPRIELLVIDIEGQP